VNEFIQRVNEFSASTGVRARLRAGTDDGEDVELFASDGRNVTLGLGAANTAGGSAASTFFFNVIGTLKNVSVGTFFNTAAVTGLSAGLVATGAFETGGGIRTGAVQLRSSKSILIGGTDTQNAFGFADTVVPVDQESALANISVASQSRAQDALAVVDATLQQLVVLRSNLGAIQNRLEAVVNSLNITNENLSAAQAEIRDADMAVEVAELTRAQILQQAGVSVLAQANTSAQVALSLLQ